MVLNRTNAISSKIPPPPQKKYQECFYYEGGGVNWYEKWVGICPLKRYLETDTGSIL